jgi:hypothetical protein
MPVSLLFVDRETGKLFTWVGKTAPPILPPLFCLPWQLCEGGKLAWSRVPAQQAGLGGELGDGNGR